MDQTVFSRRVSGDRCEFDISFGQTTRRHSPCFWTVDQKTAR